MNSIDASFLTVWIPIASNEVKQGQEREGGRVRESEEIIERGRDRQIYRVKRVGREWRESEERVKCVGRE